MWPYLTYSIHIIHYTAWPPTHTSPSRHHFICLKGEPSFDPICGHIILALLSSGSSCLSACSVHSSILDVLTCSQNLPWSSLTSDRLCPDLTQQRIHPHILADLVKILLDFVLVPVLMISWSLTGSMCIQACGALPQHPSMIDTCTNEFLVLCWMYGHPGWRRLSTTSWGGLIPALTNSWFADQQ